MVGYGAFALSYGDDPILPMPSAAPGVLLLVGLLTALTITGVAITKARRGHDTVIGKMLAASWLVGFGAPEAEPISSPRHGSRADTPAPWRSSGTSLDRCTARRHAAEFLVPGD
jgi:hypothetical protein